MKKFQIVLLFVFLAGCSSGQTVVPIETPGVISITPIPTQTVISPTETLTPSPTFTPPPAAATPIGGGAGKIAFTSERDGYAEIYVINSDGSDLIKLSNNITPKFNPAWSPDSEKIAFGTNNDDSASLYIMNADGSNPTKLIDTKELNIYDQATSDWRFVIGCCNPTWSPDGKKIAFSINHYVGCCKLDNNLFVMNADGRNLISTKGYPWEHIPAWSPNSQKIALAGSCGGSICVMNSDGTNPVNLTHTNTIEGWPTWSPDGNRITFSSHRDGNSEIYVMNANGSNQTNLTNYGAGWDGIPIWSPDGNKIAFSSYRDSNYEIYVMNADGTDVINLTNHLAGDSNPIWSPDSQKIAFVSERDGNAEIYVVDSNGSNLVRLTNNDVGDYSPVWSP